MQHYIKLHITQLPLKIHRNSKLMMRAVGVELVATKVTFNRRGKNQKGKETKQKGSQ